VQWPLVRWLVIGSVPSAFAGVFVLNKLGAGTDVQDRIKVLLGCALLVAAVAMVAKAIVSARANGRRGQVSAVGSRPQTDVKRVATLLIGVAGGFIVGMTSVGSGSLMIVMLLLLYPKLSAKELVGTDLVQAIPLVGSAALSHALFGHVDLGLTGSVLVGSLPGVYIGSRVSSRAPDVVIRPALVVILLASAMKLLNASNAALGWTLLVVVLVALPLWGATDAALRPESDWVASGHRRTTWVALQSIAAPFGIGFVMAIVYFAKVRRTLDVALPAAPVPELLTA
jgi:uncharacterized membrane protein YfcA